MSKPDFQVSEAMPVECRLVDGPHDGESFQIAAIWTCEALPVAFEMPGVENGKVGYHRYETGNEEDGAWPVNAGKVALFQYEGFRPA